MRIALISDMHGNLTALDAVLADLDQHQPDAIICLGDVATIGPQPKQVLARLKALGCACIQGNHDAALLDLDQALALRIAPPLLPTLEWCAGQLTPDDFDYLRSFKPVLEFPLGPDLILLCFHGSPHSNIDLILPTTPGEELDQFLTGQTATVLAGGHSHIQMLRQHTGRLVINPGSIGHAFLQPPTPNTNPTLLPWAEYALITYVNGTLSVDLRRIPFDLKTFFEVIAESDIPIRSWWLEQYKQSI